MKKLISTIILLFLFIPSLAGATSNALASARLNVNLEQPAKAFPDGKSCINVDFEAIGKDGTYLKNEPLLIAKPSSVKIKNSQGEIKNTGEGYDSWCVTSTAAVQSQITVKFANYPMTRKTFNINFQVSRNITDQTDRNMFIRQTPITFTAKIDPVTARGLKTAELHFKYRRRYNSWGFWFSRNQDVKLTLNCDDEGYCSTTLYGDHTKTIHNTSGNFSYTFNFVDKNSISFSRTYQGRLK